MLENFQLRPYQTAHLGFHIKEVRSLNLSQPGTGKTPTACLFINYLVRSEKAKVAFVMPKSLLKKNYLEIFNFTDFKEDEVAIVSGTPAKRQKIYDDPKVQVFLMGFDMFSREDLYFFLSFALRPPIFDAATNSWPILVSCL